MVLPQSIQDVNKPKRHDEKYKGWNAYPGIYYDKHLQKLISLKTPLKDVVFDTGYIEHDNDNETDKSVLSWARRIPDDEETFNQWHSELRGEDFEAISEGHLRAYKERNFDRIYVLHCQCRHCAPHRINYTLVYSEHDKKLEKKNSSRIPAYTRARAYTEFVIKTMRDDGTVNLKWTRSIPDPIYPDKLTADANCSITLEVPVFKALGDDVAQDWNHRRIDCIYVDQHYPCLECDDYVTAQCLKELTDEH